jgi:CheY-like chemotaxis protein
VIAVSASSAVDSQEVSAEAGCDDYVQKPVQAQELFDRMETHLELEWIYEEIVSPVETGPLTLAGIDTGQDFVFPPSSEIRELYELAECGDFVGLEKQLNRIDQMDESYAAFVVVLRELASTFRWDEVCELIEKCTEEGV